MRLGFPRRIAKTGERLAPLQLREQLDAYDHILDVEARPPPGIALDLLHALDLRRILHREVHPQTVSLSIDEEPAAIFGIAGLTHQLGGAIHVIRVPRSKAIDRRRKRHIWRAPGFGRGPESIEYPFVNGLPIDGVGERPADAQ